MITIDEKLPLEFAIDKVDASGSEVSLSAGTLAALENVVVSGEVELGATTLAALENVVVSGEVELGATTLAALENVVVSATDLDIRNLVFATDKVDVSDSVVGLDAATLAALETVTVVEGAYQSWKSTAHSSSDTASQIASTPLAGRLNITIQNLGSKDVYIGASNAVTISTGTKIAKGSSFSEKLGASAAIWVICASGETANLRIAEFAA